MGARKGRLAKPIGDAGRFLLVAGLALAGTGFVAPSPLAAANHRSGQFEVHISLESSGGIRPSDSAFCRTTDAPGAFGATVTVVCSTGAVVDISSLQSGMPWVPMHGGAYRYLVQVRRADEVLATVDSYTGLGTVTSWRVVHLGDRDYVELTVGW